METEDSAGTYSSKYALNRFVIEWENDVPEYNALAFTSELGVENYFGANSAEAAIGANFFDQGAYTNVGTLYFGRDQIGNRPHWLSGNLGTMTVAQLAGVNGSLSFTWNGWTYSEQVNLSNVTGSATISDAVNTAATDIQRALNAVRPPLAQITATIAPESVTFTGSVHAAQLYVKGA